VGMEVNGDGMRIVITGAGGVLGQLLARKLLELDALTLAPAPALTLRELVLLDRVFPEPAVVDRRITHHCGEIDDQELLAAAFAPGVDALFHLAAVVSAAAEADFDLGMRVNLDGLRTVLNTCRRLGSRPRVVFTSSVAAFGGDLPVPVVDTTAATPQSSYGTQKVVGELLVADMTRKGFIDGRTVRLPTIVIRPGKPNRAASGFMSNILREPLNAEIALCPVAPETPMWVASPQCAVDALIHAVQLPDEDWGWNRTINSPGITVTVAEALTALGRIAGSDVVRLVRFDHDQSIARIVLSWPAYFETRRADALGFRRDANIESIIRTHLRYLGRGA
jgi:nucleoside-diphosphate-sugar epimerase